MNKFLFLVLLVGFIPFVYADYTEGTITVNGEIESKITNTIDVEYTDYGIKLFCNPTTDENGNFSSQVFIITNLSTKETINQIKNNIADFEFFQYDKNLNDGGLFEGKYLMSCYTAIKPDGVNDFFMKQGAFHQFVTIDYPPEELEPTFLTVDKIQEKYSRGDNFTISGTVDNVIYDESRPSQSIPLYVFFSGAGPNRYLTILPDDGGQFNYTINLSEKLFPLGSYYYIVKYDEHRYTTQFEIISNK